MDIVAVHFGHILSCVENMFDTQINVLMDKIQTRKQTNFASSYISVCQMCFQCTKGTNQWMNKFHTIFIIK